MAELPRRDVYGHFKSAEEAFEFAVTVLQIKRGASSSSIVTIQDGSGGAVKDYQRCDALTIMVRAEACDPGDDKRPSWFTQFWLPEPTEEAPRWTPREMDTLLEAIRDFECELHTVNFLAKCGRKQCRGERS